MAKEKLAIYNTTLIKKFSMEAVKDFEDESLDFVYIDADHSVNAVTNDINEWCKKVKNRGILSGHDYIAGVMEAVNAYVKCHNFDLQLTTKNKEGISWWFVKL